MKNTAKLIITIVTVIVLLAFIISSKVTIDVDVFLSGDLYNICFWIVIPIASIILGGLYLKKHLWLSLVAVFGLDTLLWLVALGHIAIFNNSTNTEGIALICMIIQEVITLIIVIGIYAYRTIRERRTMIDGVTKK